MSAHQHSFLSQVPDLRCPPARSTPVLYCTQVPMTDGSPTRSGGFRPADLGRFTWRKLMVCLAIASLAITLASRVFHQSSSDVPTVAANAGNAKIQHRDRVAQHWSAPLRTSQLLSSATPVATMHPEEQNLLGVKTDGCLYNRPPPRA
jgi:hypothetical protein